MKNGFVLIGIIAGLIVGGVALYIASYLWLLPYFHNQNLKEFSEQLVIIPPPAKTQEIDKLNQIGQQSGNGDHCDYLSALLLKTDIPKPEVEKYYSDNYKGKSRLYFFWINEPHKPGIGNVNPTNIFTLDEWVNNKSKTTGANLIIYIFEGAMTSAIDYRCG